MKRIPSIAAAGAMLAVMALSGCREPAAAPARNTTDGTPVSGDMYVSASIGDASYLNPLLATDSASSDINGLVYNGLVKYDRNLQLTGELAERWTVSPDGLTVTFFLRRDVKWHDGVPFTAGDVEFTYCKLIDPTVKTPYGADYLMVKEFKVLDPHTVRVTYREPFAPALESWGMGVIPRHIFAEGDINTNPANRKPVGTGPYRFKEWKTDEKIVLEANPDYFEGKPYIDRYVYRIVPDQAVQFLELRQGGIDQMGLTPDQWRAYDEFFASYNKFRYPSFAYTYFAFNLRHPWFREKKFRQAIAHAVNKQEIIDSVLLGMGKTATGPFPPQLWAYDPSVRDYEFDPGKTARLLGELGWERSEKDGYFYKDGRRLEFAVITNQGNKMRALAAEIIQSQLRAAGIRIEIRVIEWSSFIHQFVDKRNFDAIVLGWNISLDPDQYSIWHSGQTKDGQYNFVSYANPEVDRLLVEGRRTFDRNKRREIYHRIHAILSEDVPYIFLYYPESLPVVHKRFRGPEVTPAGLGWNFPKWWVPSNEHKYEY